MKLKHGIVVKRLVLTELTVNEDGKYVTVDPLVCEFETKGVRRSIEIPAGYVFDGATGWRDVGHSWVFHDFLYQAQFTTRRFADEMMLAILRFERNNLYYSMLSHVLVLFAWKFERAWRSHTP